MSMSIDDGRRVAQRALARTVAASNGPPDTETFDRRRVDPPAGCRAAAEPAILTGRWSDTRPTEEQLHNRIE
jgi:hypothetical protein